MKLLRQPLLHFVLLGAAIFALNAWFGHGADALQTISIGARDVGRLAAVWERQWGRPPSDDELRGLLEQHIREEVLYREAVALGLDKDDIIIRRRLAQKLEFLAEDLAADAEPAQADLETFYGAHPERYREQPRLTFSQVYFSSDRHGAQVATLAGAALARLRAAPGLDAAAARELGDPFMLQSEFADRTPAELDRLFGGDFGARLATLPIGSWQGPLASSFGLHLILVTLHKDARLPELAEIRDAVARDYLDAKRREANATLYQELRAHYRIVVAADALPPKLAARP